MSARKMLVVVLDKTQAVVGAATRRTAGVPAVADLVGTGLLLRMKNDDGMLEVPADDLIVKEVDYVDDVLRQPLGHVLDSSGTVITPTLVVNSINATATKVTLTLNTVQQAEKAVLVFIDGGPNVAPLKFAGKTAVGKDKAEMTVSGIPSGQHLILATVDGHAGLMVSGSF